MFRTTNLCSEGFDIGRNSADFVYMNRPLCFKGLLQHILLPLLFALSLSFAGSLQAQRIFDTEYVAEEMGLDKTLSIQALGDFETLPAYLDSIEHAQQLDSTDYDWLCLQVFRVCGLVRTEGHEAAEAAAIQCLTTPPAQENNYATRILLALEGIEHYWVNPGMGDSGTRSFLKAIEWSIEAGDAQLEFDFSIFLASIYMDFDSRDLAQQSLKRAKDLLPNIYDALNCHLYYTSAVEAFLPEQRDSLGRLIWDSKEEEALAFERLEKAIACTEEAFAQGHRLESDFGLPYQYRSMFAKEKSEVLYYQKKALPFFRVRDSISLAQGHARLSEIFLEEGMLDSAMTYLDSSRVLATKYGSFPPFRERYYKNHARYYELLGGEQDSLILYQMLFFKAKAEATNIRELAELERYRFEKEQTQQKLTILQQQSEIDRRAMWNRSLWISLFAFGLIATVALFSFLRIRSRNKVIRQKNLEIEGFLEELEKNLEEKTVLVQEVNHRVKNNLQMITAFVDIQAQEVKQAETAVFADRIRRRIRAVSLVHELIIKENRLAGLAFSDYALELISELEALYYQGNDLVCHRDIVAAKFDLSTNMYLGILLNELVSNSMKHAAKEGELLELWVQMKRQEKGYLLTYRDSGSGMSTAELEGKPGGPSIGLKLMHAMAKQLEGNLEYDRENEGTWSLEFPDLEPGE